MNKCAVSSCPNRLKGPLRPKRFFRFPADPARVRVWLTALREDCVQSEAEQRVLCEDHFLPQVGAPDVT